MYELDGEIPDFNNIVRLDSMQEHIVKHSKFFKTHFRQCVGEARRVDRKVEFSYKVRKSPDVVFVPVSTHKRGQVIAILFKKLKIRNGNIDTVRSLFRESHSGVDDDHF